MLISVCSPTFLGKNLSELLNPKQRETRGAYLLELNVGHYKILNMKDFILNTIDTELNAKFTRSIKTIRHRPSCSNTLTCVTVVWFVHHHYQLVHIRRQQKNETNSEQKNHSWMMIDVQCKCAAGLCSWCLPQSRCHPPTSCQSAPSCRPPQERTGVRVHGGIRLTPHIKI